jgi:hypothetical protein
MLHLLLVLIAVLMALWLVPVGLAWALRAYERRLPDPGLADKDHPIGHVYKFTGYDQAPLEAAFRRDQAVAARTRAKVRRARTVAAEQRVLADFEAARAKRQAR